MKNEHTREEQKHIAILVQNNQCELLPKLKLNFISNYYIFIAFLSWTYSIKCLLYIYIYIYMYILPGIYVTIKEHQNCCYI